MPLSQCHPAANRKPTALDEKPAAPNEKHNPPSYAKMPPSIHEMSSFIHKVQAAMVRKASNDRKQSTKRWGARHLTMVISAADDGSQGGKRLNRDGI